jgi:serine/threonine-protein kinase
VEGTPRTTSEDTAPARIGGRYVLRDRIGSGGMATVYLGYDEQAEPSMRTVAIKRMHPWLVKEPDLVATLLDEGRVVSHIAHPNVVAIREVVVEEQELFLVLEYVEGEPLGAILRELQQQGNKQRVPLTITCALVRDLLRGLHAAHEAKDERGRPLGIVHRDVSPHNVLVGVDGLAHLLDFGVAKAAGRAQSTRNGSVKGKLTYMAPEQLRAGVVTRRSDIYAASIVFWEMLAGQRFFGPDPQAHIVLLRMNEPPAPPSSVSPEAPESRALRPLDAITLRGLAREPSERYGTAAEMADAIERTAPCASPAQVAAWLPSVAGATLEGRAKLLAALEDATATQIDPPREREEESPLKRALGSARSVAKALFRR